MHRQIIFAVLTFWALVSAMLANISAASWPTMAVPQLGFADQSISFAHVISVNSGSTIGFLIVGALYVWALLSIIFERGTRFREIEIVAYFTTFVMLTASLVVGLQMTGTLLLLPMLGLISLVFCALGSATLDPLLGEEPDTDEQLSHNVARSMALHAAHTSMLSRISQPNRGPKL